MSTFYDRRGQPMASLDEWATAFEGVTRQVASTTLPNGRLVSTVWLGIDHSFGSGPPLIFETMVFPGDGDAHDLDCDRYSTETDAIAGHARMCEKWADLEVKP